MISKYRTETQSIMTPIARLFTALILLCVLCSATTTSVQSASSARNDKKQETLSEDCFARRDSLNRKRGRGGRPRSIGDSAHKDNTTLTHQRLQPRLDHPTIRHLNATFSSEVSLEGGLEHIPDCTNDGKFEPIQCLMGYCWCVNRYGQALKNTAKTNERPSCDAKMYDSDSNDLLVVTGIGATRMKNILKSSSPKRTTDSVGAINEGSTNHDRSSRLRDSDNNGLALAPNECNMSRENALVRRSKDSGLDDIWIPNCDPSNEKLYAEKQCHKSKVCWCVDQSTGLPLHSNAQLKKEPGIDCAEVKRIIEIAASKSSSPQETKVSFFQGFSEYCDASSRSEFVINLIGQFKQQLADYLKHNPTAKLIGITSNDPNRLTGEQVASWRFALLDTDNDGQLDEREWSKFKKSFKLVDKLDHGGSMGLLFILRSQRRCWRDFLEFCGDGDVLDYTAINKSKWLSCTELPGPLDKLSPFNDRPKYGLTIQSGIPDAYTRAAAETRRSSKNPFIGILKPD